MSENPPKKRSFLAYLFYTCAIILAVIILVGYEVAREDQVNECLHKVNQEHNARWARYCKENTKRERRQLKNCIDQRKATTRLIYSSSDDIENADKADLASCNSMYGDSDSSADCLLPKALADSLNNGYEKSVEVCKS